MSDKLANRSEPPAASSLDMFKGIGSGALADALKRQGIALDKVAVPDIVHHGKIAWDDLCTLATKDKKTFVSPICVVTLIDARADAPPEFKDYKGMARIEFTTELGDSYFVTHAMTYSDTGEYLPLYAWLKNQVVPFFCRFGYIETRQAERHVVRAMPLDIETL